MDEKQMDVFINIGHTLQNINLELEEIRKKLNSIVNSED